MLPILPTNVQTREMVEVFAGYNHHLKIGAGEFYDMKNLSSDYYPLLAPRGKRGRELKSSSLQGIAEMADKLIYIDGGTLYYDYAETPIKGLSAGEKQIICTGAYIVIFPDKVYYNTANSKDYGSLEAFYSSTGAVKYTLCKSDGTEYGKNPTVSDTAPENPADGDLWVDTSKDAKALLIYSAAQTQWTSIITPYTKISFISNGEIPGLFSSLDGVTISGSKLKEVNGDKVIYALGGSETEADYIVVVNLLTAPTEQADGSISISRSVPEMDFVCQSQNRLWGCFYGNDGEKNLNELYCSALGDFKNWRQYMGLATDSWAASVGAEGPWTGAVNYLGAPIFFKENSLHIVSVSATGAHQISETACRGVQQGSHRSLQVVNETLYYKSGSAVCAYQGAFPEAVSEALGEERYYNAAAGAVTDKYYIAMDNKAGQRQLFVLDLKHGLWMKEDELEAVEFARLKDELYCRTGEAIWHLNGESGTPEEYVESMAETGILYYQYPDKKYISRFNLRLWMEEGAELEIEMQYDSNGVWQHIGKITNKHGTGTINLPVRPRRCDHMQMRLNGKGAYKLFSIARILEIGSDM